MQSPTMIGEVMLTTTSGKAIPQSSSETLFCVHWRGVPTTLPKWQWMMGMALFVASWSPRLSVRWSYHVQHANEQAQYNTARQQGSGQGLL